MASPMGSSRVFFSLVGLYFSDSSKVCLCVSESDSKRPKSSQVSGSIFLILLLACLPASILPLFSAKISFDCSSESIIVIMTLKAACISGVTIIIVVAVRAILELVCSSPELARLWKNPAEAFQYPVESHRETANLRKTRA